MTDANEVGKTLDELAEEHRLAQRVRYMGSEQKRLLDALSQAQTLLQAYTYAPAYQQIEPITKYGARKGKREGTALTAWSDWHIEERVEPEKVHGLNVYVPEIAIRRAHRLVKGVKYKMDMLGDEYDFRALVVWLGGDFITGYLRPENRVENAATPMEATVMMRDLLVDLLTFLLDNTKVERIVVPCSVGNHDRVGEKKEISISMEMSYTYILYNMLARHFADQPRIQFQIARDPLLYLKVYGRVYRFTHGDEIKYSGGINGLGVPAWRQISRWDSTMQADTTVIGHFHSYAAHPKLITNGSLIGVNTYSLARGYSPEDPMQAFWVEDAKRGMCMNTPIWCKDSSETEGLDLRVYEERRAYRKPTKIEAFAIQSQERDTERAPAKRPYVMTPARKAAHERAMAAAREAHKTMKRDENGQFVKKEKK